MKNHSTRSGSRFVNGGKTTVENGFLKYWDKYSFLTDISDTFYVLEKIYEHRPDTLSYIFYGDADYAWVILQYNNILDPIEEFTEGKELFLPTKERILSSIIRK